MHLLVAACGREGGKRGAGPPPTPAPLPPAPPPAGAPLLDEEDSPVLADAVGPVLR